MNDSSSIGGKVGVVTTLASATTSILPDVNAVVQIVAGLVAIAVGVMTFIYYYNKNKSL